MTDPPHTCPSCNSALAEGTQSCPSCGTSVQPGFIESWLAEKIQPALADRYRLEREIGRGGMGLVYLARDLKHRRAVAIKMMRSERTAAVGTERFHREIEIAAQLSHLHILPLHDSGTVEDIKYYVMPYVEGESLRQRLDRERQLPIGDAVQIAREVAEALGHAHSHGIIHRDIKPENILLSGGHALVSDFGVALPISHPSDDKLTGGGVVLGTAAYMSPEQAVAEEVLDGRSDVYSLGCVLYEMLVGDPPFTGPTPVAVMTRHSIEPVPSMRVVRDTIPEPLERAVMRALAKVAADRFQTAQQFAEELRAIETGSGTGVAIPGARLRRFTTARRAAAIGGVVVLVSVVAWVISSIIEGGTVTPSSQRLAVLPFAYHGDESNEQLAGGIPILLSSVLDGVGGLRTVDPAAVFGLVDQREGTLDVVQALEIATQLEAGRYLLGTIVQDPGGRVSVTVTSHQTREEPDEQTRATVEADATRGMFRIVNDLAVMLLGDLGIEESPRRMESISTSSGVALNEYLKGESELREGDYHGAVAAFGRAVQADSQFALAWYRMAYAQGFAGEQVNNAVARALELGDRLSERDRRLAEAYLASATVDAERADRLYRLLIADYPDDVEALFGLAEVRIHWGTLAGLSIDSLVESFERVLFFQPDNVEALMHLSWAAGMEGDLVKADSAAAELIAVDQGGYFAPIFKAYRAYLKQDGDEQRRAAEVLRESDHVIRVNCVAMVSTLPDLAAAAMLTSELFRDPALIPEIRAFGYILEAHLELARGRWGVAQERLADAAALDPVPALEARAQLSLAPFLDPSRSYLEDLRSELEEWDAAAVPPGSTGNPWIEPNDGFHEELRLYLLGAVSARLGDTDRARQLASELEPSDISTAEAEFALTLSHNLRALAWLAENRPEEAVREFEQTKPVGLWERTYSSAVFAQSYERYLRAEALEAVGRTDEALRWYTSVWVQNSFDRVYRAVSHLKKGEIFERAGDHDRALEEYSQVVELWRDADPELQEQMRDVLERLARVRD